MIQITLQEGDRLEWALKTFKRQVIQSGLFAELDVSLADAAQLRRVPGTQNRKGDATVRLPATWTGRWAPSSQPM